MHVSRDNLEELGLDFKEYRKVGTTMLAGPFDAPVNIETVTGMHIVHEGRVYIGIDSDGYPYPVAESIFNMSYQPDEADDHAIDETHALPE